MRNIQKSELERRVDEVLFYLWDPFGFNGEPFARDEYQDYTKEILDNLIEGRSSDQISKLLTDIVENRMGLKFDREISSALGKLLVRHKKAIESE